MSDPINKSGYKNVPEIEPETNKKENELDWYSMSSKGTQKQNLYSSNSEHTLKNSRRVDWFSPKTNYTSHSNIQLDDISSFKDWFSQSSKYTIGLNDKLEGIIEDDSEIHFNKRAFTHLSTFNNLGKRSSNTLEQDDEMEHIEQFIHNVDTGKCYNCMRRILEGLNMECNHNLCLVCASRLLFLRRIAKYPYSEAYIRCRVCGNITYPDSNAWQILKSRSGLPSYNPLLREQGESIYNDLQTSYYKAISQPSKGCWNLLVDCLEGNKNELDIPTVPCPVNYSKQRNLAKCYETPSFIKRPGVETPLLASPRSSEEEIGIEVKSYHKTHNIARHRKELFSATKEDDVISWSNLSQVLSKPNLRDFTLPRDSATKIGRPCSLHKYHPVEYFCHTCAYECVCSQCIVSGYHTQHNVENLEDAWHTIDEVEINSWKKRIDSWLRDVDYVLESLVMKESEWNSIKRSNTSSLNYTIHKLKDHLMTINDTGQQYLDLVFSQVVDYIDMLLESVSEDQKKVSELLELISEQKPFSKEVQILYFFSEHQALLRSHVANDYAAQYIEPLQECNQYLRDASVATSTEAHNTDFTRNQIKGVILSTI